MDINNTVSGQSQSVIAVSGDDCGEGSTSLDKSLQSNCNSFKESFKNLAVKIESKEAVKVKKKPYCGRYSFKGKLKSGSTMVIKHKCKTWGCGICGSKKLKQVKMGIYREAYKHGLQRLLSLTLPADYKGSYGDSVKYINKVWAMFRVYLEREFGDKIKYIKIVEPQKRGVAHLHILVDRYIPQIWISNIWSGLGGGRVCDIRFVDLHRISAYLSKYMTKEMATDKHGKYRRYGTSKGIYIMEKKPPFDVEWKFIKDSIYVFWAGALSMIKQGLVELRQLKCPAGEIDMFEVNFALSG